MRPSLRLVVCASASQHSHLRNSRPANVPGETPCADKAPAQYGYRHAPPAPSLRPHAPTPLLPMLRPAPAPLPYREHQDERPASRAAHAGYADETTSYHSPANTVSLRRRGFGHGRDSINATTGDD